jgi:hypothetical protein
MVVQNQPIPKEYATVVEGTTASLALPKNDKEVTHNRRGVKAPFSEFLK